MALPLKLKKWGQDHNARHMEWPIWISWFTPGSHFVHQASAHTKRQDIGANIFIGNLDPEVDEKLLYDTFSAFGVILQTPKVFA